MSPLLPPLTMRYLHSVPDIVTMSQVLEFCVIVMYLLHRRKKTNVSCFTHIHTRTHTHTYIQTLDNHTCDMIVYGIYR